MGAEGFSDVGEAREVGEARDRPPVDVGAALAVGDVLGDCEIVGLEGFGAMGAVYRARQRSLGRIVALKVIRDAFAGTPQYRERFLREAQLAAAVDHPHVVSVFDAGEHEGRLYLTMQWVQGEDLARLLRSAGRLSPGEAVNLVGQLAGALGAIHAAGLIHRDVKPANVVVRDVAGSDHAYLTDFGLAKPTEAAIEITEAGHVLGTPGYMAPEQIEGGRPGPRSDLYALGCVAFELLIGERPFRRDSELALLMAHANAPRPRPSEIVPGLGRRYDGFFATALAIDPSKRFASARELGEAFREAHAHDPRPIRLEAPTRALEILRSEAPVLPPPQRSPRRRRRRRRWPWAVLALLLLGGGGAAAVVLSGVLVLHQTTITDRQTISAGAGTAPPSASTSQVKSTQPTTPAPSSTYCGGDLTAGAATSCGFARNVELAYDRSSGGDTTVTAISPVTGTTYTMHCSGQALHVCTGGQRASMTFSSGPSDAISFVACDPNISAGPDTTCAFAESVFLAYYRSWKAAGAPPVVQLQAVSPKTAHAYKVICTNSAAVVSCSTAEGALVDFPLRAITVYKPR